MKKLIALALLVMVLTMVFAVPASADDIRGPCNGSGRDYAEHHIVPLGGQDGALGQGHKPGSHQGSGSAGSFRDLWSRGANRSTGEVRGNHRIFLRSWRVLLELEMQIVLMAHRPEVPGF